MEESLSGSTVSTPKHPSFTGHHVKGSGQAHKCCEPHRDVFNCPMVGTYNVMIPDAEFPVSGLLFYAPVFTENNGQWQYWLVKLTIEKPHVVEYAWAFKWYGSRQAPNVLELLSKQRISEEFRNVPFTIEVLQPWTERDRARITRDWFPKSWHQTFHWGPSKVDSRENWSRFNKHVNWEGAAVLDIGCNYGFYSFVASGEGARVVGCDNDPLCVERSTMINDHIAMQDVLFEPRDAQHLLHASPCDVILYLSVHHQWDPLYEQLIGYVRELRTLAHQCVIAEFILPPMFGTAKVMERLDNEHHGEILAEYDHSVRGRRRIYRFPPIGE